MINLHNEEILDDTEFLYVYTYLMTDLNFQDLADRYIVGYDTPYPSYSSRQFIHFGLIGKAMKSIIERVQKDYKLKDLLQSADEEQPTGNELRKLSDILKDMSEKEHTLKKKEEVLDKDNRKE